MASPARQEPVLLPDFSGPPKGTGAPQALRRMAERPWQENVLHATRQDPLTQDPSPGREQDPDQTLGRLAQRSPLGPKTLWAGPRGPVVYYGPR